MRIHTNAEPSVIFSAARKAGVTLDNYSVHGSRKAKFGYEVILSGNSRRRQNGRENYAADWDQWGIFLANIFRADPYASCWAYKDARDFHHKTASRFLNGEKPHDYHGDHKFVVGVPFEQKCSKCEAVRRWDYIDSQGF